MQDKDLVLGIDIGGTKTAFGFVDNKGTIFNFTSIPADSCESAESFVSRLHECITKASIDLPFPYRLCGIGIGSPNAHHERGTIEKMVNLNWGEVVDFIALVRKYYDVPVSIINDAKAVALGEMHFGKARGMKHFLVITLGTGVGGGIVADGHLLHGSSGFAGELGHTMVDPDGRQCRCGKRGCLETYASAAGLKKTVQTLLVERSDPSSLREMKYQEMTSKRIYEMAAEGDVLALEAFDYTARILGMKLADAVAHLSPEAIFLAGGLANAGDILIKPTERYMNKFLFRAYKGTVKLMFSGLEPGKGAILGAAALIRYELKS
ncbi:MAG: ROK family protein [Syntrophaceae bacterium]|nr:ROK family protein [Syntrophaceae bacterium]